MILVYCLLASLTLNLLLACRIAPGRPIFEVLKDWWTRPKVSPDVKGLAGEAISPTQPPAPQPIDVEKRLRADLYREFEARYEQSYRHLKDGIAAERRGIQDSVEKASEVKFENWRAKEEKKIREDAVRRSNSVNIGKTTEHIIPYLPDFNYNPKDCRFFGSPIDFLVFDGLDAENLKEVVFVEIKTGETGRLTDREKQVKDAIDNKRVRWVTLHKKPSGV